MSDWLLVEMTARSKRKKLSEDVLDSHYFIEQLLEKPPSNVHAFMSYWSVFESVGTAKRGYIEISMILDGVLASFYHEVKDEEAYTMTPSLIDKMRKLVRKLLEGIKRQKALELVSEASDIDAVMSLMLEKNLEAPDSFHVGIARSHGCDIFLTRDSHYRKVKALYKKEEIEVLTPTELLDRLNPKKAQALGQGTGNATATVVVTSPTNSS